MKSRRSNLQDDLKTPKILFDTTAQNTIILGVAGNGGPATKGKAETGD